MEHNINDLYAQRQEIDLRIAFSKIRQDEAAEIIVASERDAVITRKADDFYKTTHRTTERKISRAIARNQLRRAGRAVAPIARIAVFVLLFFYVSLSVAIAASPAFRNRFTQFLVNIGSEYTALELRDTDESFHVPDEWQGDYYLSYIPDGYSLFMIDKYGNNNSVTYIDVDENLIAFSECGMDTLANINTEDMNISYVNINGKTIFSAQREDFSIYTWSEFDRYFILSFSGKTDISEDVLKGILRIR